MNPFEVVISGISGKFPDSETVSEFEEKLKNGESFMSIKDDKWPINYKYKYTDETVPAATGKLKYHKEFDPVVFKINRATASCTDLNRIILEPTFEAIMDAGINPYDLDGRNIAVYTASAHCDTDCNATASVGEGRLWILGASKTMLSNRISFAFNLTGPSLTFNNDIFGSLAALDEAYKNVSQGHVEAAIVGVFSAILHPNLALHLARMNFLSMDAVTRVFDQNANGYGRSDAVVAFYIQRSEDAKRAYATIDFSGYTYYGSNPNAFLAYEEDLLKESLKDLYSQKNYQDTDDISFLEMSACGLQRFDRIEANAVADIICAKRQNTLMVGSVKSNVGNTEMAAPFVGVIKAILALESGSIIPNRNLDRINDEIRAFAQNKLQVITQETPLPSNKIAVNSVGIAGALGQIILRGHTKNQIPEKSVNDNLPRLAVICGRTEDGINEAIKKLEKAQFNAEFISLLNDVFGTNMPFHIYRGYTLLSADINFTKKSAVEVKGNRMRQIWFLFSGMGSQWNGMGNGLLDLPIFAETVRRCDSILKPKGIDIYHILTTDDPTVFDNIVHSFVGIVTIQIALVEILKAIGIKPDGIIGHSVGENACAYADNCLTLEQAVLASYARGVASMQAKITKGMMAAVGKGYNQIKDALPENIEVACHNSSTSSTLSGPAEDVEKFVKQLQDEGVFARAINVADIAFHSKYIAPAGPSLLTRLQEIITTPTERSSKWISTSIPENEWDKPLAKHCSAEYLTNNLLNQVLFEEGCKHIPSDALVIEIAPHGLLQAIVKRSLSENCANVSLTLRNKENKNLENLLTAIGKVYISGCDVNVNALYPSIQYPVPRGTPSLAPFATWNRIIADVGLFRINAVGSDRTDPITVRINEDSPYQYLKHHQINNKIILPSSLYLYMTWWVFSINQKLELGSFPIIFEDIKVFKNISISLHKPKSFTFSIQRGSGTFEVVKCSKADQNKTTMIMTGVLYQPEETPHHKLDQERQIKTKHILTSEQFYDILNNVGYQLDDTFCNLEELAHDDTDHYAKIKWNENWVSFLDSILKFSLFSEMRNTSKTLYPRMIRKLEISAPEITTLEKGTMLLCHKEISTNVTTCDGLLMCGVRSGHFSAAKLEKPKQKLQGLRFISHKNPRCENVEEFFKLCLEIVIDNMVTMVKRKNAKLSMIENEDNISQLMKQIIKKCDRLKSKVRFYQPKNLLANKYHEDANCLLIMTENISDVRKYNIESCFVLTKIPKTEPVDVAIEKSFVEITKQSFLDDTFYLLRQKSTMNGLSPHVLTLDENCTRKYVSSTNTSDSQFIIKKTIESADLSLMFPDKIKSTDPRYLFVMDEEIPNDLSLQDQLNQDLFGVVLKDKEWGSYRSTSNLQYSEIDHQTVPALPTDIQIESISIRYLGTDNSAEQEGEDKFYKHGIEYSGIDYSGVRIMGLSSVNTFEPISQPDCNLTWTIPKHWSLEDAATVPFIYAQAYNIFRIIDSSQLFTDTILVNFNDQGLLAEACISIILQRKYTVYITVANYREAAIIKNKFPQIKDSHIFNQRIHNYEIELLKATKGKGVHHVINCFPDTQSIQSSLNCLHTFGYCIHVADIISAEINSLGLWPFVKSLSLVMVTNKISSLLNLATTEKQQLKLYVDEGIKSGIVVPFERNVQIHGMPESIVNSEQQNHIKTIFKCFPETEMCTMANQRLQFNDNRSYIIVAGDKKNSFWFELVEWLITKGAKKFIIAIENFTLGPKISHQMNRLVNQNKITIILTSSQKFTTVEDSTKLIKEANAFATLEAIFFVSMESACSKIRNADIATQQFNPNIHLISLLSGGLKELESRRYRGSPALVIHGEKSCRKLSTILPFIQNVIEHFDNGNSPTLYRIIDLNSNENQNEGLSLKHYLPSDIGTLESIGSNISETPDFVEVTTLSPRFHQVKDTTPIFVISAFGPEPLKGLFSNLIYPAFCTTAANCNYSAAEIATILYKSLNHIQREGGITLVAETWQRPVALELSNLIKQDGRKYKLCILEGNPSAWQERTRALEPANVGQFENNLITQIFSINPMTQGENTFKPSSSLSEKISYYLSLSNYTSASVQSLTKVTEIIRNGLILAYNYNYKKEELVQHTILMVRRLAENEVMNLSVSSELFVHDEDDYYTFLSSPTIARKINDEVIYNMWYTKEKL